MMAYALGVPPYANTAPLYQFLEPDGWRLCYGVPAELNRMVLSGEVGLSLVSSYFYLEHQEELGLLPDFSVAVLGRVYSVNLFHKGNLVDLRRIALTTESATSVELLKLLLGEQGVFPQYEAKEGGLELLKEYDGVLLIGDKAIQAYASLLDHLPETPHALPTRFGEVEVVDLSMLWFERTRLPFVFAVWAYRRENPPPLKLVQALRKARRQGLSRLGEVAEAEAKRLGIHPVLMEHYLWNFRYHLEEPDRLGLKAFADALGLPFAPTYYPA
ncbi:solute-binding protein [Thermus scotoductus]|uniref:Chorismate dehydratase n=2 Tax=Thermaceae TaxID=188786 RepID=A0A430S6P6_THESC|nr:solute-binding protein [Thermus scotoductus]RTH06598.1 solute-binding protein [Thermus scotoductus]RTH08494.1 solute-binding protein [Thermus scotoductus]RTH11196.1 solute-binding protein [Thermus scotoductus]RTH16546.1 solute-binding protein [Thermus scotoductus]